MNFKKFIFTLFTYLIGAVFLLQTYTTPVFAESSLQDHYQNYLLLQEQNELNGVIVHIRGKSKNDFGLLLMKNG